MRSFFFGCLFTLFSIAAIGFGILWLGLFPVNADAEPYWLEKKLAHIAVDSYVERQIASLNSPLKDTPDVLMDGMKLFKSNCAGCHGSPSNTDPTFANAFYPKAPQIGIKGTHGKLEETFWITKHGIRMSGMPAFTTMLSDDEIWKISHFLNGLKELPPEIKNAFESNP